MKVSIKNKAKDRDRKGRIRRKYTSTTKGAVHFNKSPKEWRNIYMTRPERREVKSLCKLILSGIDSDSMVFPVSARKPHILLVTAENTG